MHGNLRTRGTHESMQGPILQISTLSLWITHFCYGTYLDASRVQLLCCDVITFRVYSAYVPD